MVVLVVPACGWVYYLNHQLDEIPRFELDLDRPGRPAAGPRHSMNILLVGADDPDGSTHGPELLDVLTADDWPAGAFRSDAIMVLHLPPDRESAQLVSLPRDSYVPVPGYGRTKINAAFSYGGPQLLARTIEDLTDIRITHVAVIDFAGLARITDIVGGVPIHFGKSEFNPVTGGTWRPGTHRLDGAESLAYVRQRKQLLRGDFDRVQRQQNYLRALMTEVIVDGILSSPPRTTRLAGEMASTIAVDRKLTNGLIRRLAWQSRGVRPADVLFATVPYTGTATIDGASVVVLDDARLTAMFRAFDDGALASYLAQESDVDILPPPSAVD